MEPSPYLPTSRRFVNPMYLRVEAIPEFAYVRQRGRIRKAQGVSSQARAQKSELIDRDGAWKVKRSALEAVYSRRSVRPAGNWRMPRTASGRAAASTTSPPGVRWPRSTAATGIEWPDELQHPADPGRRRLRRRTRRRRRLSPLAAVAARRSAHRGAGDRGGRGHGAGDHARPRRRRGPQRSRRVGAAGRAGARRHRGRTARRVQPARPGLVAAAVAARRTREPGVRAVPRSRQRACCGTRAASASTTSSGCSGCGGSRRARRRPRAPTSATTTRR